MKVATIALKQSTRWQTQPHHAQNVLVKILKDRLQGAPPSISKVAESVGLAEGTEAIMGDKTKEILSAVKRLETEVWRATLTARKKFRNELGLSYVQTNTHLRLALRPINMSLEDE